MVRASNLALIDLARDKPSAARADIDQALRHNAELPGARQLRDRLSSVPTGPP